MSILATILVFVVVLVVAFALIAKFFPAVVTQAANALPKAAGDSLQQAAITAANMADNAAVDSIKANLEGMRSWFTSADAKAHIDALEAENETFRPAVKS